MKIGDLLYRLIILVLVAVLLVSGFFIVRYVINSAQQKSEYDALAARVESSRQEAVRSTEPAVPVPEKPAVSGEAESTAPAEPTEPTLLPDYASLYEENSDMVGWMVIDGVGVNYPVMQTPDRPDYYLYRNFNKQDNVYGCLYAREACDVFTPSDNVTIYGHRMNDGTMFGSLKKLRDKSFWEEYHTIQFDTIYEHHEYTIFAVFQTSSAVGVGFPYHLFITADSEEEFDEFVATCKDLAFYDTGITPEYGDKIICLSTCVQHNSLGRMVVAAVRTD